MNVIWSGSDQHETGAYSGELRCSCDRTHEKCGSYNRKETHSVAGGFHGVSATHGSIADRHEEEKNLFALPGIEQWSLSCSNMQYAVSHGTSRSKSSNYFLCYSVEVNTMAASNINYELKKSQLFIDFPF